MPDVDFTAFQLPAMAVSCPSCGAPAGTRCKRPSEHEAGALHAARGEKADRLFIRQHGEGASIEKTPDGWRIDPTGYAKARARERETEDQGHLF